MNNVSLIEYINGRKCTVLGLGVSNLPLAKAIIEAHLPLTVYDKAEVGTLGKDAEKLMEDGAHFVLSNSFQDVEGELIFRSPGIRPDRITTVSESAEISSEMELFLRLTPAKTFAVTGSDGKTTSTTLTGLFLAEEGKRTGKGNTFVGGNIGTPLLTKCGEMTAADNAVLELSSFQLMGIKNTPDFAAITNVSPNHLDWHVDMDEYVRAKKNIIGENTRRLVTNADCEQTLLIARECAAREDLEIILFSSKKHSFEEIFEGFSRENTRAFFTDGGYICVADKNGKTPLLALDSIRVPGQHNVENFMTAMALTYGEVDASVYKSVAESFCGVEHRLELVRELDGVAYYNSSIDSSPTRTAAALGAMAGRSIVLIAGGYDKKIPYAPLACAIVEHGGVHTVSLTGATGKKIGEEIEKYRAATGKGENITIAYNADFGDAVRFARESAGQGDVVLLSPASASFDAFKNFAERGVTFKNLVKEFK